MNQLPPGPKSNLLWQTLRWTLEPLKFQDDCQAIYGDTFTLKLVDTRPRVIIGNPQDIKEIFSHDAQYFDAGRGNQALIPLLGQNSLFTIDGDRHKQHRQLLMPSFHHQYVKNYAEEICKITNNITREWAIEKPLSLRSEMQKISLEIIIKIVFSISDSERYEKIKRLIVNFLNIMDSPVKSAMIFFKFLRQDWGKWSWWGQLKQTQKQIDDLLQAEIESRRNQTEIIGKDILSLMMSAYDDEGNNLNDQELKDELITLFIAGHETLTTSLTWAFYQIYRHEEIKEKLETEINGLENKNNFTGMENLPYLTATISETLRMYPISPMIFPRVNRKPVTIGKYTYSTETFLCPSIYLVHYREDIYPEAHQFKPERFIDKKYAPYEYFPFGGGDRRCLGYALAQLEMKLIISFILQNHRLKLFETDNLKMKRRSFGLSPSQEIMFRKIPN